VLSEGGVRARTRSSRFRHGALSFCLLALGWLPWLPVFLRQRAQVQEVFWTSPLSAWDPAFLCYRMFIDPMAATCPRPESLAAALACLAGLLALAWRGRAGGWYVLCGTALPFALSVAVTCCGTKVFYLRYFLFTHALLLVGLAVLIGRAPGRFLRTLLAAAVVANFLYADLNACRNAAAWRKPGARGAAAYLASRHRPGEPVVVCSTLSYFTSLYYTADFAHCRMYSDGTPVVHYHGGSILIPDDSISGEELRAIPPGRVWVVNAAGGAWGPQAVPVPAHWVLKSQELFPEVIMIQGTVTVLEYEVPQAGGQGHRDAG
jgi:hypothetical protein